MLAIHKGQLDTLTLRSQSHNHHNETFRIVLHAAHFISFKTSNVADNGKREPNPSTQLRTWTTNMRATLAQVMRALQGISKLGELSELGNLWDKRKHTLEAQKSRALKEVKALKTTPQKLIKDNEAIQAEFDKLQDDYATLETNQTSMVKGFDMILTKVTSSMEEYAKDFERLKEALSLSTTSNSGRKCKDSIISDGSLNEGDSKHQKIKKDPLPLLEGEPPKSTLSKTFTLTPELPAHHERDIGRVNLVEIGNNIRKEINEHIAAYNVTENDQHEAPALEKVLKILQCYWYRQFVTRIVLHILIGPDDLIYKCIELIFDAFMALMIDEFTFNGDEILMIRLIEDEHVADTKTKCSSCLIERFPEYEKSKLEYAKRCDVDCNKKCGHAEGIIEVVFDPTYGWY